MPARIECTQPYKIAELVWTSPSHTDWIYHPPGSVLTLKDNIEHRYAGFNGTLIVDRDGVFHNPKNPRSKKKYIAVVGHPTAGGSLNGVLFFPGALERFDDIGIHVKFL